MNPARGYVKAKALLKEQFGNEQKVASAYMEKALLWPPIKTEDVRALQDLSFFLRGCCNAMEDVQYLHELDLPSNMLSIIRKLPYKLRDRWRNQVCELQERNNQRVKFKDIADFIEKQVKVLTDPVFGNIQDSPSVNDKGRNKLKSQVRSGNKGTSFATIAGIVEEKHQSVKEKEIIPSGHISRDCRKRISCTKCSLKHPTVLHKEPSNISEQTMRNTVVSVDNMLVTSGLTGAGDQDCKLPIVPVQVKSNKGSKIITTYAFLDQGSTAVFCTESLMHKLHLTGRKGCILLRTMGQEKVVSSNIVSGLEVASLDGDSFLELPKAYTQESMPVHKGNIPTERDIKRWSYLKTVQLPQIDAGIELLIGTNVPKALEPLEVVCSVDDGPYAIRTMLGWTVNGPLTGDSGGMADCEQPQITVNRVSAVNLDELWQQQFQNDFPENCLDDHTGMSREDHKFLELVINSVKHVNGHYQIALPLRNFNVSMPNNKNIVKQRLYHLKRKLQKDPVFYAEYNTFLNDLLLKDYAEKVPEEELDRGDGKVWYIPHHGVYHPTKKKIRVVFDCGASYQGTSLNAQLLQGPNLTSSLIGVVTRFRREHVVIMADIESMFYQVRVPSADIDLLRFLWWPEGDLEQQPVEYRMKVHLFGAASSPSCANFALRRCAEDNGHHYSEKAVEKLLHCFYVDDCLVSVVTEEEAVSLYKELISLCASGGFSLTKWMTNRPGVLESIPKNHRAKGMEGLNMTFDSLPVERVLGVEWCIQSDSFKFKIVLKNRPLTRRGILSTVSSIYDPLGMLSPVVLTAKKILRDLCRREIGWDDTVPESTSKEWLKWLQQLHLLDSFKVDRCVKPSGFGDIDTAQLHHFCDASQDGYGMVSYLLLKNNCSEMHSAFIMGKARVAPLKTVTIPRMELIAATMASRMDVLWRRELQMDLLDSVFWTDSQSVLKYIRNETSRFKVFVANRVSQILKASHPIQWRTTMYRSLTKEDVDRAELAIIKFCQRQRFPEELDSLEKEQHVKKSSHLYKLCPQLQDGIMRVGGRLSRLSMPVEVKHPIILSKDLHISELLLRHVHQEVGHGGRNHMLSKLREKYWMTGASVAIRKVLSKCIICRRLNALPVHQQMADMPHERIVVDEPPFTCVGVDYFGPFEVKSRRSRVKRYGVIFTCLAIRAVHLEVASSLDTDSFINALRRFIARRGQVRELRSDNGTNFVGAERELKAAIEQWNHMQITDFLLQKGIKWSFNPPAGSHHGGSWERLI
ncbi:hypothetical protein M9458_024434, partial [Cirrhinus mrigala]